ncbi:MAG: L-threonylcarbamoyladenylate synthase [Candidatus Aureabacteria bacterium]|nr:L-threonylcarbamoyladenylate synthase [Candidatus Auribacterota bacterium]
MTLLLHVDPYSPDPGVIARAAEAVKKGGVIVFPTETVYGLGGDAGRPEAARRIYRIKGRPEEKPLVRLVADWEEMEEVRWDTEHRRLAEWFWPGPLTLILPLAGGGTQGFRFPDHDLTRRLVRAAGVPFAATSANRSGEAEVKNGEEAERIFFGEVDLILDAGEVGGQASTVLDLSVSPPRLLREGPISWKELEKVLGLRIL